MLFDKLIVRFKKIFSDSLKREIQKRSSQIQSFGKIKVFGIGLNKTGTTSLKIAMEELGFIVAHQRTGERLMHDWAKRDFSRIIKYCETAQFFQDAPFSKSYTYIVLDYEFPGSKFVLTVRDSAEQWYNSLTQFHAKKWGKKKQIPTKEDLQQASYIKKAWAWDINRMSYKTPEDNPYKKDTLLKFYDDYNQAVKDYFRHRPEDLLVLNVAEDGSYQKLCSFLGVKSDRYEFPWKNKTKEVKK